MKKSLLLLPALLGLCPLGAASLDDVADRIDLDGSLVAFIDFEGDGAEIAESLNAIYAETQASVPDVPPIPIDFSLLFENLGFSSVKAMAFSSKEIEDGLYANRSAILNSGSLSGLFGFYGNSESPKYPFDAAALVPADAQLAFTGAINLAELKRMSIALLTQFMGPMGEGLAQQQLANPIPGTEVTADEVIAALSGTWDFGMIQDYSDPLVPVFKIWLRVRGSGDLVTRLKPLADTMPIAFSEKDGGTLVDFSALTGDAPTSLFLEGTADGDLLLYTNKSWTHESGGPRLSELGSYQSLMTRAPETSHWFTYSSGLDIEPILSGLAASPETAPYAELIEKSIRALLGGLLEPSLSITDFTEDAMVGVQYAEFSTKQAIMLVPAAVGAGIGAAVGMTTLTEVQETSQEKAILNNLRQLSSAADQFMLEEGVSTATHADLVGPDKYVHALPSVAGESYEDIVITAESEFVSVTLPDGTEISIDR